MKNTNEIQDMLNSLSEVFTADHALLQKTQFDEFVRKHEFDLALHLVCDYLISEAALITVSRMVTIDDLHAEIQIRDNCISGLEDARAQYEQLIET